MNRTSWSALWRQAQADPLQQTVLSLLFLNGLPLAQIERLPEAAIDLESGWITAANGSTYPLVSYAIAALRTVTDLAPERIQAAAAPFVALENEAHRKLAGAIWITDEEHRLMLELTGSSETPIVPLRFTFPFSVADVLHSREISQVAERGRSVLQTAADWLVAETLTPPKSILKRVVALLRRGSLIFLVASTGVSGLNLIHNMVMGRLLSPADYSQLTFLITVQLLVGLLPTTLQTIVARFTARYQVQSDHTALAQLQTSIGRFGWRSGLILMVALLLASPLLITIFALDGFHLLLPILIALPFFVRMGVDRGRLQGIGSYIWLSGSYLTEGLIRLGVGAALGYLLLEAGSSLEGAIWGLAQSMLMGWFISWLALRHFSNVKPAPTHDADKAQHRAAWRQLGTMTALVLVGQALITNSDFLLVKTYFSAQEAGFYAAVSVLGRIVYFGALPLTILLIPLIARRQALNEPTRQILLLLIGGGVGVCSLLIVLSALFAPQILGTFYGEAYLAAADLLAIYAIAASLYTLTNLVVTYQIALGKGGETWMPILAGVIQIAAIVLVHETLSQVIIIQVVLMALLFSSVLWRVLRADAPNRPSVPADAAASRGQGDATSI